MPFHAPGVAHIGFGRDQLVELDLLDSLGHVFCSCVWGSAGQSPRKNPCLAASSGCARDKGEGRCAATFFGGDRVRSARGSQNLLGLPLRRAEGGALRRKRAEKESFTQVEGRSRLEITERRLWRELFGWGFEGSRDGPGRRRNKPAGRCGPE